MFRKHCWTKSGAQNHFKGEIDAHFGLMNGWIRNKRKKQWLRTIADMRECILERQQKAATSKTKEPCFTFVAKHGK